MKLGSVNLGYLGEIRGKEVSNNEIIEIFKHEKVKKGTSLPNGEYSKCIRPYGQIYYIFSTSEGKEIYKVIPLVKDDSIFRWEPAQRYGSFRKHAVVDYGNIVFDLLAYEGEDYRIKIRMKYCGKEILSHDVYNADNALCLSEMEIMLSNLSVASTSSLAKLNVDKTIK